MIQDIPEPLQAVFLSIYNLQDIGLGKYKFLAAQDRTFIIPS